MLSAPESNFHKPENVDGGIVAFKPYSPSKRIETFQEFRTTSL